MSLLQADAKNNLQFKELKSINFVELNASELIKLIKVCLYVWYFKSYLTNSIQTQDKYSSELNNPTFKKALYSKFVYDIYSSNGKDGMLSFECSYSFSQYSLFQISLKNSPQQWKSLSPQMISSPCFKKCLSSTNKQIAQGVSVLALQIAFGIVPCVLGHCTTLNLILFFLCFRYVNWIVYSFLRFEAHFCARFHRV